jgi:hypothetical protein
MKHAKLAERSGHKLPAGQFQSLAERDGTDAARSPDQKAVRKKTVPSEAKPARSLRKEMVRKSNQTNWCAAIAGATTWRRVSSSGGIAAAASVSANATGRRHERRSRRSRSKSARGAGSGPGLQRARPLFRYPRPVRSSEISAASRPPQFPSGRSEASSS